MTQTEMPPGNPGRFIALERARQDNEAHGEFESECPGYCAVQDTFYVGTLKGVGRVYQQTCIDTYSKVAFAKLYDRKTPITAADLLNDRVVPFFDDHEVKLSRVLTDRGTEYCGTSQAHEYELYLAVEDIDHTRTKARSPQTNGICERFHKTVLHESTRSRSASGSMAASSNCRPISMPGSPATTSNVPTRAAGAMARPRCNQSRRAGLDKTADPHQQGVQGSTRRAAVARCRIAAAICPGTERDRGSLARPQAPPLAHQTFRDAVHLEDTIQAAVTRLSKERLTTHPCDNSRIAA